MCKHAAMNESPMHVAPHPSRRLREMRRDTFPQGKAKVQLSALSRLPGPLSPPRELTSPRAAKQGHGTAHEYRLTLFLCRLREFFAGQRDQGAYAGGSNGGQSAPLGREESCTRAHRFAAGPLARDVQGTFRKVPWRSFLYFPIVGKVPPPAGAAPAGRNLSTALRSPSPFRGGLLPSRRRQKKYPRSA